MTTLIVTMLLAMGLSDDTSFGPICNQIIIEDTIGI